MVFHDCVGVKLLLLFEKYLLLFPLIHCRLRDLQGVPANMTNLSDVFSNFWNFQLLQAVFYWFFHKVKFYKPSIKRFYSVSFNSRVGLDFYS